MTLEICMAGPELRIQCPAVVHKALMGSGQDLPYLFSIACADGTSRKPYACQDLRFDHEASFT